ncbi:3'-5' exonuclease [Micromonospora matsumotoense]|uniref:3'-5' exonuclease n=2 Tax=Micromonospora matsumotoense TaxID=121616 RepID=A0A1C5ABZ6_9ACTN|nr:3'-5' exonuclease [Micromonospora matsumotoense]
MKSGQRRRIALARDSRRSTMSMLKANRRRRERMAHDGTQAVAVSSAPRPSVLPSVLADRINGRYLVGHNINVDWRLLHRQVPGIQPAGLIDTLRLARTLATGRPHSLASLIDALGLTDHVNAAAPGSQPHRALWDTIAAAMLLPKLINKRWAAPPTITELVAVAGIPTTPARQTPSHTPQPALF